jgi:DNA recombination protein RmuC
LYQFALSRRVVVAGPSSLISILWAVALVMRQYHANQNLEEVAASASEMYARVQTLVGHIVKMGSSLDSAVEHYNKFLGSMETRVIVQANRLRELRATSSAEPIREVTPIDKVPQHINPARWEEAGLDLDSLTSERVIDVTGDERELGE